MAAGESEQPSDEAAGGTRRPLRGRDVTGDLLERGGVSWVGVHGGCDIADPQSTRDGEAQLAAQVPGAAGDNGRANQDATAVRDQLDEPVFIIVTRGSIHPRDVPACDRDFLTESLAGGRFACADLRDFGIGERDPGHRIGSTRGAPRQERIPRRFEGLPAGHVRKLLTAQHIACGVNMCDVGSKSIVYDNASIRMGYARMVEREATDIRTTA